MGTDTDTTKIYQSKFDQTAPALGTGQYIHLVTSKIRADGTTSYGSAIVRTDGFIRLMSTDPSGSKLVIDTCLDADETFDGYVAHLQADGWNILGDIDVA